MTSLFVRAAKNIQEEYNENDIETPDKYKELYDYVNQDVMGIILSYVPIVEFEWGHPIYPVYGSWNITVEWKGRYTHGFWHGSNVTIQTKPDVITCYTYYDPVNTDFIFPCYSIKDAVEILENLSTIFIIEVYNGISNVYRHSKYDSRELHWQIKVPPQLIVNELQFVHETAFKHTQYKINQQAIPNTFSHH